ncbi:MAG: TonB-dependent receptor [Sorangium cellulosum]|nr:MAG: TonB-dependent receptor [Sorangium cellulosum]
MLDRVEVYRGNAPRFADRLGIGGAVFFEPKLPKRTRFGVGQSAGSFGGLSSWIAGTVAAKNASSLVAFRRFTANNDYPFRNDGGTRFSESDDFDTKRRNADHTTYDAWAIGRQHLAPGSDLTFVASVFDREQGVTGLSIIPARKARGRVRRFLSGLSARVPCQKSELGEADGPCQLSISSAMVAAHTQIHDPLGELSLQSSQISTDAVRFTQRAALRYRVRDVHELSVHASQASEQLRVEPAGGSAGLRAQRNTSRLTASLTYRPLPKLGLHAIAAIECHTTNGPTGNATAWGKLEPSGRLGVRVQALAWLTLLANAGRYIRPPTLGELYGTSAIVRGNADLIVESGSSVDLGIRATRRGNRLNNLAAYLEIFAFNRWVSNLIAFQRSSFGVIRPFNVGTGRIAGLELAAGALWLNHIKTELNTTLLDPRDRTAGRSVGNDLLPFRSRFTASQGLEVFTQPTSHPIIKRASLGTRLTHRSSRFADPAGLIVIKDHTTLDFELSAHFVDKSVAARLALRNALNEAHFDTVGYPLPGRSYYGSIEAWF